MPSCTRCGQTGPIVATVEVFAGRQHITQNLCVWCKADHDTFFTTPPSVSIDVDELVIDPDFEYERRRDAQLDRIS